MTPAEYHAYQKRYYAEHRDYFEWYRKKHQARTNARKRERYHNDPEYRRKELERKWRKRHPQLVT